MENRNELLLGLRAALRAELEGNILPYWIAFLGDGVRFDGRISGDGQHDAAAPKGAVLMARLLWSFSAIYNFDGSVETLEAARKAYRYYTEKFFDREFGGVYWSVDADGRPLETRKQSYAAGFGIYALSEYYAATGDRQALALAFELFDVLERHAYDSGSGGYIEALACDWQPIEDMRLSEKDENAIFSMNSHLHILEPYTALYRVSREPRVAQAVERLLQIFVERIYNPATGHLGLFFTKEWARTDTVVSYGHDIEASWLMAEAEAVLGCRMPEVDTAVAELVSHCSEGILSDGSLAYELDKATGRLDAERHWWVQAEAVVGFMTAYRTSGEEEYMTKALGVWRYIAENIVDRENGEWFWSRRSDGKINCEDDKAGFWKCPYHNSRMCIETISLIDLLLK